MGYQGVPLLSHTAPRPVEILGPEKDSVGIVIPSVGNPEPDVYLLQAENMLGLRPFWRKKYNLYFQSMKHLYSYESDPFAEQTALGQWSEILGESSRIPGMDTNCF